MSKIAIVLMMAGTLMADLRYTSTVKGGMGAGTVTKHLIKGNKMKLDSGATVIITDIDAQTVTTIMTATKTYRVTPMSQVGAVAEKTQVQVDVKETGQKKSIAGYNCRLVVMTMNVTGQMPMTMESEMWVSNDVPGAAELKAIGMRMAERSAANGAGMQKAMLEVQKQSAKIQGVPVLTIMRMKSADEAQNQQMQAMRAQMEAMKKKGGPGAAAMEKAMAGMGGGGGKYLMEVTTESSEFSGAAIAASEFAAPAGFKKVDQ